MEISLLEFLLSNISSFFRLSSDDNIKHEPAHKYYQVIEDILKLLNPLLSSAFDADVAFPESLQKAVKELNHSVDVLRDLFENWHPLRSKIYFVLEVETVTLKVRHSGIEILKLMRSSDQDLPNEFDVSAPEIYVEKIEHMSLEQTSIIVNEAIREQEDGSEEPSLESLVKFANSFSLKSNQELLIEAVALEKLKDNAEQAENNNKAEHYDQLIALVTHMHKQLVTSKQSESSNPVLIPADFCCPLSLELMTDPVIVASGQTYERAFIRKWIDLGLTVCPKTRQTLSHTNLIPNYTLKALIANWCEIKNVKLPNPMRSATSKPAAAAVIPSAALGSEPSSESLVKFANSFSLKSNQELLIEAVALKKLKDSAEQAEKLVAHMDEQLVTSKVSESSNPVLIPADFRCPHSLKLMMDPVIVASGQTYERAFIRKWIDLGITVCPKTRQPLRHTCFIPNYTLKALIANWCKINNVKLPNPVMSAISKPQEPTVC